MRLHPSILALIGLLLPVPAFADVTIRYAPDPPGEHGLLIEADGQGRIRAETAPGQLLIMRDGETFVVALRETGAPTVARLDDFLAVVAEAGREFRQRGVIRLRPPSAATHYRLSDRGPEAVGVWPGTRVAIEQIGQHDPSHDVEWVVSSDPALAEVGRIVNRVFEAQTRIGLTFMGGPPPEFAALVRQLSSRGTPLRMHDSYRLESLGADPVPAGRFDLPGPVLSREQLRARQPH